MVGLITPANRILVASHRGRAGSTICLGLQPAIYINGLQSASPLWWCYRPRRWAALRPTAATRPIFARHPQYPDDCDRNGQAGWHEAPAVSRQHLHQPKFAEQPIREEALLIGPLEPTNAW